MLKAIKIRLYPNKTQENTLNSLLGSYRFVFNQCLAFKKEKYETEKKNTSLSDLGHHFHQTLRGEYEWLKEHNTKVLKQSIINLEQAYKNFFKQGRGFPRFKSKYDEQKARFPQEAVSSKTFNELTSRLNLTTTIKGIKFECSARDKSYLYKNKSGIKSVTIIKNKAGYYFASILIDGDLLRVMDAPTNESVGIDLGIKTLLTLSNGSDIANPKWIRNNEKQLKHLHRQLSKKHKGSNNRHKAKLKLAKKHENIKNQKLDFLHNLTTKLVSENQVICMEDLNVSGMMRNRKLAKAIQELGLGEMRRQIEYKSQWYGRDLMFVDRFFPSSKTCSDCGWKHPNLKLSDREFCCEGCGLVIDRDLNASINIKNEGMRLLEVRQRLPEPPEPAMVLAKLAEHPTMDDKELCSPKK
jgi:putative transposase